MPVAGMTCTNCPGTIERRLRKLPGVRSAAVDFAGEKLTIIFDPTQLDELRIANEQLAQDITARKPADEQLTEQLDELHRWYTATQGREGRILELKHEVNKLLALTGLSPRSPSAEAENQ
jgi:copper chaperone CopZ